MLSERFSRLTATIRFRLMLWMIVVVFVLVVVAMFAVRQIYRARLMAKFDQDLNADVEPVSKEIRQCYPDWQQLERNLDDIEKAHPLEKWFAEVYDETGRKLAVGGFRPPLPPFAKDDVMRAHDVQRFRLIVARFHDEGFPPLYLRIGGARQPLDDDLAALDLTMMLRSTAILLLAPLGGYVLALRATRPIARIIATAARLEPSSLQERLPIRGTGDELDQLSQTINGLLDRIASYINRNREFVANAAHELRSPLAAIRSSVEVALNRPRSPDEYGALLGEVMEECQYLSNLVNRLLILAEGDAGRLGPRRQTVRLDRIVAESLNMFEAAAESSGIRLESRALPVAAVSGDEFHLRQVVRNLLDNAIKFSSPGQAVMVALAVDHEKRSAILTVQDQGIGIPADDLPHIFERFFRGDKARQRGSGRSSGLGLSICQSIVAALGGTITAASQVGRGSLFTVRLPLASDASADGVADRHITANVG